MIADDRTTAIVMSRRPARRMVALYATKYGYVSSDDVKCAELAMGAEPGTCTTRRLLQGTVLVIEPRPEQG